MVGRSEGAGEHVFAFEMALTRDEMVRLAPHLDPARPIVVDGRTVIGRFGTDAVPWSMTLGEPRERAIGLIRIAVADAVLRISGADEATAARFLERFHLVFRKGGG